MAKSGGARVRPLFSGIKRMNKLKCFIEYARIFRK